MNTTSTEFRLDGRCLIQKTGVITRKIAELAKLARKLGVPEPTLDLGALEMGDVVLAKGYTQFRTVRKLVQTYTVVGHMPVLPGDWQFVGVIKYGHSEPMVWASDQREIDEIRQLDIAQPRCVHCDTVRQRDAVLVVRGADEQLRLLGSTCVKDFLGAAGRDLENIVARFSLLWQWDGMEERDEEMTDRFDDERISSCAFPLDEMLAAVAFCQEKQGRYIGKQEASNTLEVSTAGMAFQLVLNGGECPYLTAEQHEEFAQRHAELVDDARAAIVWASRITPKNEYEKQLRIIARDGFFVMRRARNEAGLAGSIWPAYRRACSLDVTRHAVNEYAGTVGERPTIRATLQRVTKHEGQYGFTARLEMRDEAGRLLVWWCSTPSNVGHLKTGDVFTIKGTIKEHKEFNGQKQTILSRCKVGSA